MSWKNTVLSTITTLVAVDADVSWRDEGQGHNRNVNYLLSPPGIRSVGKDDFVQTYNVGTTQIDVNQAEYKIVTIGILCEVFDHSGQWASELLETLRTRLKQRSTRDLFNADNIAVTGMSNVQTLPTVYDDRVRSCASFDLSLGVVTNTANTAIDPIENVIFVEELS